MDTVQQRLSVTFVALSGLLHYFGVTEPTQLTRNGAIVPAQFSMSRYREVEGWAADQGIDAEWLGEA